MWLSKKFSLEKERLSEIIRKGVPHLKSVIIFPKEQGVLFLKVKAGVLAVVGLPVDGKKKKTGLLRSVFFIGLSKRYTVFNKSFQLALWCGIIKISINCLTKEF